jgi:hypothetical protein
MAKANENHISALASPCNSGLGSEDVVVLDHVVEVVACQLTQKRAVAGSTMRPSAGNEADGAMYALPRRACIGRIVVTPCSALRVCATGSALALTFFGHDAIALIRVVDPSKNLHEPAAPAMSEKLGRFGLRHDDFSVFRDSRAAKGVPSIPAQLQANSPPRHSRERITALTCTVNVLSAWSTLLRARTPHLLFRRVAPLSPAGQRSNPD